MPDTLKPCDCFETPLRDLTGAVELGMDSHFAEVSLLICRHCGQTWLRYYYELEAFPASGRWFLGAITAEQDAVLRPEDARAALEGLDWYHYGGSYFSGRPGKSSGQIFL